MTFFKQATSIFCLLICAINLAYATQGKPLNYGKQISFKSDILNTTTSMNLYLPSSFEQASDDHAYPVIFINGGHGEKFFLTLVGIVKHLSELDRIPESIVVGLNDSGYYPKIHVNGMWTGMEVFEPYGDPEKYLQHLKLELFPYLKKNYRAADFRTLIGISGSAVFPLYTLSEAPEVFDAHVFLAAADMIGMGYKSGESMIDDIAKARMKYPNGYLYFASADDDLTKGDDKNMKNWALLKSKMAPAVAKGYKFEAKVIENERHYDAFIKTMLGAFEMMFPEKLWAPKYRPLIAQPGDAMANIDKVYQKLSAQYGFTILPKGDRWNNVNCLRFISGMLFREGRIDESVTVAQRWVQYRPDSVQAYEQLAKSLEAADKPAQASTARQTADKLSKLEKKK